MSCVLVPEPDATGCAMGDFGSICSSTLVTISCSCDFERLPLAGIASLITSWRPSLLRSVKPIYRIGSALTFNGTREVLHTSARRFVTVATARACASAVDERVLERRGCVVELPDTVRAAGWAELFDAVRLACEEDILNISNAG